jgi:hypothetical protein
VDFQPGQPAFEWLPLKENVFRWIQGFHAALYRQSVTIARFRLFEPFVGFDDPDKPNTIPPEQFQLVAHVKRNRAASSTDGIRWADGNCTYECVWIRGTDGTPNCVFALDLYGWHDLGRVPGHPLRSCVGAYAPSIEPPESASWAPLGEVQFSNLRPLDAFEH